MDTHLNLTDDLVDAVQKLWAFASKMQERHGPNGDDTMDEADALEFQEAGACANNTLQRAIEGVGK